MKRKKILYLSVIFILFLCIWGCEREQKSVDEFAVTTSASGNGEVIKTPFEAKYSTGSKVKVLASPESGWDFSHWEKNGQIFTDNLEESLELFVNEDVDIVAVFKPVDQLLKLNVEGEGKIEKKVAVEKLDESNDISLPLELKAIPEDKWIFLGWLGVEDDKKDINPIVLDKHENLDVKAVFLKSDYSLMVEMEGNGKIKVEEVELSQSIKNDYSELEDSTREINSNINKNILFVEGSIVQLTAIAEEDWKFSNWNGDISGNDNPIQFEVNEDLNINAIFEEFPYYALKTDIDGEAEIEINIIDIPFQVEEKHSLYPSGTELELRTIAEPGWDFVEWTGNVSNVDLSQNPIRLELNEDIELTAILEQNQYLVELDIVGSGNIEEKVLELPEDYQSEFTLYPSGAKVEFTAIANENWEFSHWEGDIKGSLNEDNPIILEIQNNVLLKAVFKEKDMNYYSLNLETKGEGEITERLIAGNTKDGKYSTGSEIELEAISSDGWNFNNWTGEIDSEQSSENPINIILNEDTSITANFSEKSLDGDVNINGNINLVHNWPYSVTYESPSSIANLEDISVKESSSELANIEDKEKYIEGEIVVGFSGMVLASKQQEVLSNLNLEVKNHQPMLNNYLVKVKEGKAEESIERLLNESGVRYAEPNYIYQAFSIIPEDDYYYYQWHYPQVRLPQAWESVTGSSLVRVAVLDTGVDSQHPDLQYNVNVEDGYNFTAQNTDTNDKFGHGTHVAGTIAADTNNNQGVAGIMWEAEIIPVKVLDDDGYGSNWDIAQGILYAAGLTDSPRLSQKADIINMSLGGATDSDSIKEAVVEASNAGVLIVAAAGNSNTKTPMYPASYPEVISVGSVELNYPNAPIRAPYSCYGDTLDVMAPGGNTQVDTDNNEFADGVLSTTFEGSGDSKNHSYIFYQGTSMAAPHVSGLLGLMLANGISNNEAREILRESSFDLGEEGFDNEFGYGLVNAYWAVNRVNSIKILAGEKEGDSINILKESLIGIKDKNYLIENIPAGNFAIYAWVDINSNNIIDTGDYFAESEVESYEKGSYQIDFDLKEVE
ncbi:MAG: S8 family serine peptidase [Candidatus Woesearchaeota archaeon]